MESLLQTAAWAALKAKYGWITHEIDQPKHKKPVFVLEREIVFGQTFLYAPEVSLTSSNYNLSQLVEKAKTLAKSAIFFRLEVFEPLGEATHSLTAELTNAGFRKSFEETQPEHRQWVDISGSEAVILANMKEKCRYNVRLAARKGVTTRVSTDTSDVDIYYELFQETAKRNGFSIRSKQYFIDLCTMLFKQGAGELIIAEFECAPLTALIITYYDGLASYLYGASSNSHRNLMAPYAAHFAAIQAAKTHGCETYDLLQIAPLDAPDTHPYTQLTRFKEQFGGRRVDLVGGWDYVFKPSWYQCFKFAEQVRRK